MALELISLDWNGNKLEHKLEQEDMKRTLVFLVSGAYNAYNDSEL